jgi:hypothetical protein
MSTRTAWAWLPCPIRDSAPPLHEVPSSRPVAHFRFASGPQPSITHGRTRTGQIRPEGAPANVTGLSFFVGEARFVDTRAAAYGECRPLLQYPIVFSTEPAPLKASSCLAVMPARDEAPTVGAVVEGVRRTLGCQVLVVDDASSGRHGRSGARGRGLGPDPAAWPRRVGSHPGLASATPGATASRG